MVTIHPSRWGQIYMGDVMMRTEHWPELYIKMLEAVRRGEM